MYKRLVVALALGMCLQGLHAQQAVPARSQVIAYDDVASLLKEQYHDSPYYMDLSEVWNVAETDSSFRYTYLFEVESSWKDYHVYLSARGGKALRVSLNGKEMGYADDSRHWNEFLLSPEFNYKKPNTLVVETMKQAQGAMLESAELTTGLNGTPYLLFKNEPCVSDYTVNADYDAVSKTASMVVEAVVMCDKRKGKYYLEAELLDAQAKSIGRMGKWLVFSGRSEETVTLEGTWGDIAPWTAETPVMYHLVLRLRNEKMEEEELLGTRVGFRRVEVNDGQLLVNGKAVTLKGVLYGMEKTDEADAREQMLKDVVAMKAANINAVRTARFSPVDPYFYNLCDRYGLYVVADANLMPVSEHHLAVATDASYAPLFERRVQNLYGRYKNQTCIIAWSLGSTTDNGVCMIGAYKRLKALEGHRPIIFSAAEYSDATDIISPILPEVKSLRQSLSRRGDRPYLMMEAVEGNNFAALEPLWALVEENRQLQGGFATWWPMTETALADLRHLFSPFVVKQKKVMLDECEFVVFNRNDFAGFGNNIIEYNLFTNMRSSITGGDLQVVVPAGGNDMAAIKIPRVDLRRGEELFIRFDMRARVAGLTQGSVTMGTAVFPLHFAAGRQEMMQVAGAPDSSLMQRKVELVFSGHEDWHCEVVDDLLRRPNEHAICHDYMLRYVQSDGTPMCDVRLTHSVLGGGDELFDYVVSPSEQLHNETLRPMLRCRHIADSVQWFGLDREVCFTEHNAGIVGIYKEALAPMTRQAVRWCTLRDDRENTLYEVVGDRFEMVLNESILTLMPRCDTAFRLHMRVLGQASPSDVAGYEFPRMATGSLQPPVITSSELRFSQPLIVTIESAQPCTIRYTLDGSEPNEMSPVYSKPITITSTTLVKARAFADNMTPSFTTTRKFSYDFIVRTTFSRKASTPYNVGADTLLFDGLKGTLDELTRGWLGFAGGDVDITVQLAHPIQGESMTIRFAHAPDTWSFAPQQLKVALSADGVNFGDTVTVSAPFDPSDAEEAQPRVVEMQVPLKGHLVGVLRIMPQTLPAIPAWHRGKGLKPWLMIDEVEVVEAVGK